MLYPRAFSIQHTWQSELGMDMWKPFAAAVVHTKRHVIADAIAKKE